MTTTLTITGRVTAGAAWLDEQRPGWWQPDRLDLDKLDMSCGCCCIGGQVFDEDAQDRDVDTGYDVTELLFNGDGFELRRHGFADDGPRYAQLSNAWRELILARRAGTETTR
jgi:hypothetical protein